MSQIRFQPFPHIPPIGFFEPISTDPKDMMTDVEYLLGILKKLNEVIKQVNENSEFINNYSGKIEEIEAEIASMRQELTDFEGEINQEITRRFNQIVLELNASIATTLVRANAYTDSVADRLEAEIREISIGEITLYDPSTGTFEPLQTVIDNLYNASREDALTATEYDDFELTATVYDGFELTASVYDQKGKSTITGLLSS